MTTTSTTSTIIIIPTAATTTVYCIFFDRLNHHKPTGLALLSVKLKRWCIVYNEFTYKCVRACVRACTCVCIRLYVCVYALFSASFKQTLKWFSHISSFVSFIPLSHIDGITSKIYHTSDNFMHTHTFILLFVLYFVKFLLARPWTWRLTIFFYELSESNVKIV